MFYSMRLKHNSITNYSKLIHKGIIVRADTYTNWAKLVSVVHGYISYTLHVGYTSLHIYIYVCLTHNVINYYDFPPTVRWRRKHESIRWKKHLHDDITYTRTYTSSTKVCTQYDSRACGGRSEQLNDCNVATSTVWRDNYYLNIKHDV